MEKKKTCSLCGIEKTSIHTQDVGGFVLYACKNCLELTKDNFVWYCIKCKRVWYKDKEATLELDDMLEEAKDLNLVMAIDSCVNCETGFMQFDHTGGMSAWN